MKKKDTGKKPVKCIKCEFYRNKKCIAGGDCKTTYATGECKKFQVDTRLTDY